MKAPQVEPYNDISISSTFKILGVPFFTHKRLQFIQYPGIRVKTQRRAKNERLFLRSRIDIIYSTYSKPIIYFKNNKKQNN